MGLGRIECWEEFADPRLRELAMENGRRIVCRHLTGTAEFVIWFLCLLAVDVEESRKMGRTCRRIRLVVKSKVLPWLASKDNPPQWCQKGIPGSGRDVESQWAWQGRLIENCADMVEQLLHQVFQVSQRLSHPGREGVLLHSPAVDRCSNLVGDMALVHGKGGSMAILTISEGFYVSKELALQAQPSSQCSQHWVSRLFGQHPKHHRGARVVGNTPRLVRRANSPCLHCSKPHRVRSWPTPCT